jgi:hypothetical protein
LLSIFHSLFFALKAENEPLVPADTPFLLTTDSVALDTLSSSTGLGLNVDANERYFDRPEVLKAFREQLLIETPQFVHVADLPSVGVGGRFRPRGSGDVRVFSALSILGAMNALVRIS